MVKGESAAPAHHYGQRHGDGQEVIFNSLAFLIAGPVHEQAELLVDHGDGCHHITEDAEGGNASEESKDESHPAEELGGDGEKRERRGNAHLVGEKTHGGTETITSKPAQHFLRAVSKKDSSQRDSENRCRPITLCPHQVAKHNRFLLSVVMSRYGLRMGRRLAPRLTSPRGSHAGRRPLYRLSVGGELCAAEREKRDLRWDPDADGRADGAQAAIDV